MDKVQSSTFLFWFLLECLPHVCLPYPDNIRLTWKTANLPGSRQFDTTQAPMEQSRGLLSVTSQQSTAIPRRPGLVHVISVASISFVIALISGLTLSYVIYRLVKAEEKQQLALLYENVEIPILQEKEASEEEGQDESSEPHSENEDLGKFIGSVIRTKRRENILKKKKNEEQNILENTPESSDYTEQVESHDKMEDENGETKLHE
ncbi:uncharacterized protein C19orf18 homolog [Cricetulus griseus]|uniref:Uncharacterized protein C19orf18 homolog n=1 Tax=Cricetulus griseus TaxID=10029 RepID=A0A9J7GKK6_CRIGR|nr:uncharacterized protein C19orf18 homolog [Cricetulus griseus]